MELLNQRVRMQADQWADRESQRKASLFFYRGGHLHSLMARQCQVPKTLVDEAKKRGVLWQ